MKKLTAILVITLMLASLLTPSYAADKATDIPSKAKFMTVVDMYESKTQIIRPDAQFIAAPSYTNKSTETDWKAPGSGTRSFTITGADKWEKFFNDNFLASLDKGTAKFNYDCVWSNITGPMKYNLTIPETGNYEIVKTSESGSPEEDNYEFHYDVLEEGTLTAK